MGVETGTGTNPQNSWMETLKSGGPLRLVGILALCAVALLAAFWLLNQILFFFIAKSYVEQIAETFQMNRHLADAILWATFAAILFLVTYAVSLSRKKRIIGSVGILALLVGHSLLLWYGSRNV